MGQPAPRLHPNVAEVYRSKIAALYAALKREESGEVREPIRVLVEAIEPVAEAGRLAVEVRGGLAAMLALAGSDKAKRPGVEPGRLWEQVELVAGAGFEPATFRL